MAEMEKIINRSGMDTFQARFCARYKCRPDQFERKVLWKCVAPWSVPVAGVVWLIWFGYFESDLDLIDEVKRATSYEDARNILACSNGPGVTHWLRRVLKIRMSRKRLTALIRFVMESQLPAPSAPVDSRAKKLEMGGHLSR